VFRISDHVGSLVETRSGGGGLTSGPVTFAPYGQQSSGSSSESFLFAGMEFDGENLGYHTPLRQYSPAQGRWLSPDPYNGSYDLTDPQTLNRYSYARSNPLLYVDTTGGDFNLCTGPFCPGAGTANGTTWTNGSVTVTISPVSGAGGSFWGGDGYNSDSLLFILGDWCDGCGGGHVSPPKPVFTGSLKATPDNMNVPQRNPANNGNQPSWWGTFAKSFFQLSGGPGNVPTCAETALGTIFNDLNPFSSGPSVSDAATAGATVASAVRWNQAMNYAASQGLTTLLRSSVYRGLVGSSEALGSATGVLAVGTSAAAVHSTITTSNAARSGNCAAAFPVF
jgi:RHS repeat-associated protein